MAKKVKQLHNLAATVDSFDGYNMIDLGLPSGTLWADRNIGASKPEEYGHYFAWGEVEPKYGDYTWETYTYLDNPQILSPSNDAATYTWGRRWCTPTKEQFDELIDNCEWKWISRNGINGIEFTSKTNGETIFFPAAGYRCCSLLAAETHGFYLSSCLDDSYCDEVWNFAFHSNHLSTNTAGRFYGLTVRAVEVGADGHKGKV